MSKASGTRNVERENEILKLQSDGKSYAEIAEKLGITAGTVGYYVAKSRDKNGGKNHANGITNHNGKKNSSHAAEDHDLQVKQAFLTGTIVGELRGYAASHQISFSSLALGVAEGLRAFASGK